MKLRSGCSFWPQIDPPAPDFAPLDRDIACDVLIVGSGITGALMAYHLARAGVHCVMADRRELDWDFEDWMRNMAVPEALVEELATIVESTDGRAREQLHPERREGKLHHAYWHCLIRAHRPE